jgi:hypothetical protein
MAISHIPGFLYRHTPEKVIKGNRNTQLYLVNIPRVTDKPAKKNHFEAFVVVPLFQNTNPHIQNINMVESDITFVPWTKNTGVNVARIVVTKGLVLN